MRRISRVDTNDGKKVNRLSPAILDPNVPQMLFPDGVQNAQVESSIWIAEILMAKKVLCEMVVSRMLVSKLRISIV